MASHVSISILPPPTQKKYTDKSRHYNLVIILYFHGLSWFVYPEVTSERYLLR